MRGTLIFAGSSIPELTAQICTNLGTAPAAVELSKFANGETSVKIMTSIREKDVFICQSGSSSMNDSIMELLIMISACKGGSAKSITAVIPYFPYSRQSKKKAHRGAITARMLANLLSVAGVNHVITIDLHASQMQGFFRCPVDNLHAEPLIARWIRHNIQGWHEAVCVSKNAGGTKRATSLADALKLNFGMVTTDRKRGGNMSQSMIFTRLDRNTPAQMKEAENSNSVPEGLYAYDGDEESVHNGVNSTASTFHSPNIVPSGHPSPRRAPPPARIITNGANATSVPAFGSPLIRSLTSPARIEDDGEDFDDERAQDVTHGRLVQGHVVPDDHPSPTASTVSGSLFLDRDEDPMTMSRLSLYEPHALGGTHDAAESSDEEEAATHDPSLEQMITLVGDVKGRTVFIIDDMIDKAGSWIAAAEAVVKRGGAKRVYCIATHGLFGGDSLQELQDCDCIDHIVVTSSFPISEARARAAPKLVILDLSALLSEAIRRNHYGESISALFQHGSDY